MRTPTVAAAGLATTGLAAGTVLARRAAARRAVPPPPGALPDLPPGRGRRVSTEDGVELHVEEFGAQQPTGTVVLAHGYVQSSRLWAGQVRDLLDARPELRVVTYDHRGHGASGRTAPERATIEQLGRDLARVLDEVAPAGPVVLGGHSMGGMTIMALAEQHPELFGDRVTGAALVATSAGDMDATTWGLPAPVARLAKRVLPVLQERAVRAERAGRPRVVPGFELKLIFAPGASPEDVQATLDVHRRTSAETVAAFRATFSDHDRLAALAALAEVPALVAVGEADLLTPLAHSRALADALPAAEFAVYPGAGHMVQVERRPEVSRRLLALVERAVPATDGAAPVEALARA